MLCLVHCFLTVCVLFHCANTPSQSNQSNYIVLVILHSTDRNINVNIFFHACIFIYLGCLFWNIATTCCRENISTLVAIATLVSRNELYRFLPHISLLYFLLTFKFEQCLLSDSSFAPSAMCTISLIVILILFWKFLSIPTGS